MAKLLFANGETFWTNLTNIRRFSILRYILVKYRADCLLVPVINSQFISPRIVPIGILTGALNISQLNDWWYILINSKFCEIRNVEMNSVDWLDFWVFFAPFLNILFLQDNLEFFKSKSQNQHFGWFDEYIYKTCAIFWQDLLRLFVKVGARFQTIFDHFHLKGATIPYFTRAIQNTFESSA